MRVEYTYASHNRPRRGGFSLAELVISVAIAGVSIGGIVWGYVLSANRAEWTLCSSAAQAMAMRHLEQTKTARWDSSVNELVSANFPDVVEPLDIPLASAGTVSATNTVTITLNTPTAPDPESITVRVDCTWSLVSRGPFTNTTFALRYQEQ